MAYPTPVNGQITDAVTQSNVSVVAEAPAMAMGTLFQASAHSLGILMENAVSQQQQAAVLAQAVTTQSVANLFTDGAIDLAEVMKAEANA